MIKIKLILKKKFIKNFFFIFFILFFFNKSFAIENKILFKVNNEIVTSIDLLHEIKYLSILNKNLTKLENQKVFDIAKNSLIREKIKEIELLKNFRKLSVDEDYYNVILLQNARKIGLNSIEEFKNFIKKNNLINETIKKNNY